MGDKVGALDALRAKPFLLFVAMASSMGLFIAGLYPGLLKEDSDHLSLSIPTIFGAALGPFICDMGGRKWGILASDGLFIIGLYLVRFNEITANLITGVAIGMATFSFPLYISEKTPSQLHPPFIGLMGFWITVGIYTATFFDPDSSVSTYAPYGASIVPIAQFILVGALKESPVYLTSNDRLEEAWESLEDSYPLDQVEKQFNSIRDLFIPGESNETHILHSWWSSLKTVEFRTSLYAGLTVQSISQLCGFEVIQYVKPIILAKIGSSSEVDSLSTLVLTLIGLVGNTLLNKSRIKNVLLVTLTVLGGDLLGFGCLMYFLSKGDPDEEMLFVVASIFIGVFLMAYTPGLGTGPWLYNIEAYKFKERAFGTGLAATARWLLNLAVTSSLMKLIDEITFWRVVLLYFGFTCLGIIFIWLLVPQANSFLLEEAKGVMTNEAA